MKAFVVYDSLYGNTERVARAIGQEIAGEVGVRRVSQVDPSELETADLLIIGSPTHGSLPTEAVQGLLERIGPPAREEARAATFDTRLTWWFLERWGGFAASKMAGALEEKGWSLAAAPEGFFVKGLKKGPLKRGEVERASAWARTLL